MGNATKTLPNQHKRLINYLWIAASAPDPVLPMTLCKTETNHTYYEQLSVVVSFEYVVGIIHRYRSEGFRYRFRSGNGIIQNKFVMNCVILLTVIPFTVREKSSIISCRSAVEDENTETTLTHYHLENNYGISR